MYKKILKISSYSVGRPMTARIIPAKSGVIIREMKNQARPLLRIVDATVAISKLKRKMTPASIITLFFVTLSLQTSSASRSASSVSISPIFSI